ncbi:DinB family protein [Catenovulum sediminis]|uniref:DinB family protein n=1 Tax=Catenovulum sediminis TaxID=1740262 RepID=A0ABV1RER7_9ALTE|nr:DinB family protein [Catenovulum sediminis]
MLNHYQSILQQAIDFIQTLSDTQYSEPVAGQSSVGAHLRHIIDHFHAILTVDNSYNSYVVDYNVRTRGSQIESDKAFALDTLHTAQKQLGNLTDYQLQQPVTVVSEVGVDSSCIIKVQSSVARELMFATSHAVHHFALMKLLVEPILDKASFKNDGFGVAPATLDYERHNKCVR